MARAAFGRTWSTTTELRRTEQQLFDQVLTNYERERLYGADEPLIGSDLSTGSFGHGSGLGLVRPRSAGVQAAGGAPPEPSGGRRFEETLDALDAVFSGAPISIPTLRARGADERMGSRRASTAPRLALPRGLERDMPVLAVCRAQIS